MHYWQPEIKKNSFYDKNGEQEELEVFFIIL